MPKPLECVDVRLELDGLILGDLDSETQLRVLEHLAGCAACQAEREAARGVIDRLSKVPALSEQPPAGVADWVLAQAGGEAPRRPSAPRRARASLRAQSRGVSGSVLLLAAALLVALGLGVWGVSSEDESKVVDRGPSPQLSPSPSPSPSVRPSPSPSPSPSPQLSPSPSPSPSPQLSPSPSVRPSPSPSVRPSPSPSANPSPLPSPAPAPGPSGTESRGAAIVGRIEQGRAPGFTKPGAPVLAGAVLSPLVGVRIALEGGGVLLVAKRSRVTLTEHSLELSRGDALLDLRGAREDWILTVGGVSGQLVGGGRCLLGLRAGRSKLAVMNGVATLGEHSVATGRALELSARRGKVSPWVPGEPKWARKLRPAETLLLDLASDLRSGGGAWDNATLEEVGGRQTLVLGADGSGKHGVVASRRFKAVVGPDVELEVEVEVREALQIQINLKNDTRDDNSIWKFEAKPGGVQSFRRALGRFKAANKSRQAFREGDLANKITLYVGEPGETPRVVVFKVRLVKTR